MHPIEQREDGDCLRAVLASLLHVPLDDVPRFKGNDWQVELNRWLAPLGLAYVQIKNFRSWAIELGIVGCHHELTGHAKRDLRKLHATVGIDGRTAHDPDPSRRGLADEHYSGLLVALRPWEVAQRAGLVLREKAA